MFGFLLQDSTVLNTSKSRPSNTLEAISLLFGMAGYLGCVDDGFMMHSSTSRRYFSCCEETNATGECRGILLAGGSNNVEELTDFALQCFGPSRSARGSYTTGFGVLSCLG